VKPNSPTLTLPSADFSNDSIILGSTLSNSVFASSPLVYNDLYIPNEEIRLENSRLQKTVEDLNNDLIRTDQDYQHCKELLRELFDKNDSLTEARDVVAKLLDSALTENAKLKADRMDKPSQSISHESVIFFRSGGNFDILSNFAKTPFSFKGVQYNSAEQAYQYQKAIFHGDQSIARSILKCKMPNQAKKIAKKVKTNADWDKTKLVTMKEILSCKFDGNKKALQSLKGTKNARLLHNVETDSFWGCGVDGNGLNALGTILEEIRDSCLLPPNVIDKHEIEKSVSVNLTENSRMSGNESFTEEHITAKCEPVKTPQSSDLPGVVLSKSNTNQTKKEDVLIIGNSNVRGWANELLLRDIHASSFVYPGSTVSDISKRIDQLSTLKVKPKYVLLHICDVDANNSYFNPHQIAKDLKELKVKVLKLFQQSKLIISGLPIKGIRKPYHLRNVRSVNEILKKECDSSTNSFFLDNSFCQVKDGIHFSKNSANETCRRLACFIKKSQVE
jgi:ribA/ribD-fused uncharacterized protein